MHELSPANHNTIMIHVPLSDIVIVAYYSSQPSILLTSTGIRILYSVFSPPHVSFYFFMIFFHFCHEYAININFHSYDNQKEGHVAGEPILGDVVNEQRGAPVLVGIEFRVHRFPNLCLRCCSQMRDKLGFRLH